MTVETILLAKKCGDIFTNDASAAKSEYRQYVKEFHPDVCKDIRANDCIIRLNLLYKEAQQHFVKGTWEESDTVVFHLKDNSALHMQYISSRAFELGKMYIGKKKIVYVISAQNKKYTNGIISNVPIKFTSTAMKDEFSRYLPRNITTSEDQDGNSIIQLENSNDELPLSDVLDYYNGAIQDRHVAWIISRLCNFACFIQHNHLAHNGLTVENCFINPGSHQIRIQGGWWYAAPIGTKMIGVSKQVYNVMPVSIKSDKQSSIETDLECIKQIGRTLLGKEGMKAAPSDFITWLKSGACNNAIENFNSWNAVLNRSYGERRFVKMELIPKKINAIIRSKNCG